MRELSPNLSWSPTLEQQGGLLSGDCQHTELLWGKAAKPQAGRPVWRALGRVSKPSRGAAGRTAAKGLQSRQEPPDQKLVEGPAAGCLSRSPQRHMLASRDALLVEEGAVCGTWVQHKGGAVHGTELHHGMQPAGAARRAQQQGRLRKSEIRCTTGTMLQRARGAGHGSLRALACAGPLRRCMHKAAQVRARHERPAKRDRGASGQIMP